MRESQIAKGARMRRGAPQRFEKKRREAVAGARGMRPALHLMLVDPGETFVTEVLDIGIAQFAAHTFAVKPRG